MASGSGEGSTSQMDDYETLISTTDVELLKTVWRNEKAAPEILRFETALVQRTREQIQLMEDTVGEFENSGIDPLTVSLYQMDLDRTQFLLRSYLRIRLQKIEKFMFHISKNTELWNRLSGHEKKFAERCTNDLDKHLSESVLSKLPNGYQSILKQFSESEEDDMVPEPPLDTFIVCKSKGFLQLSENRNDSSKDSPLNTNEPPIFMEPNELYFVQYKLVKIYIESGQIDLV